MRMTPLVFLVSLSLILGLSSTPAYASRGQWLLGTAGMKSGTQPEKGVYFNELLTFFSADTFKNIDGQDIPIESLNLTVDQNILAWITDYRILGGALSVAIDIPVTQSNFELDQINFRGGTGLADTYLAPLGLGWNQERFDASAKFAFIFPTGKYNLGALDNTGRGQWTFLPTVGATYYLDPEKKFFISALGTIELPLSDRRDSPFRQGQYVDLEYSLGATCFEGMLQGALVGYAGFQISDDRFLDRILTGRTRIYGLGPHINVNIPVRSDVILTLMVRDYFEFGAQFTTQANVLFAGAGLKF